MQTISAGYPTPVAAEGGARGARAPPTFQKGGRAPPKLYVCDVINIS